MSPVFGDSLGTSAGSPERLWGPQRVTGEVGLTQGWDEGDGFEPLGRGADVLREFVSGEEEGRKGVGVTLSCPQSVTKRRDTQF